MKFRCLAFTVATLVAAPRLDGQTIEQLGSLAQQAADAQNAGNYADAERLHRQVLEGVSRLPGFPDNERARQMMNLASVINIRGDATEALELLQEAERLLAKSPAADSGQSVTLHFNFARSYSLLRDWKAAEDRYQRGFQILEAAKVFEGPVAYQGLVGLAYVYGKTNRVTQAVTLYEKVLPYFRNLAGPEHPAVKRWEQEYAELAPK